MGVSDDAYARGLVERARRGLGERLVTFGLQPFDRVPEFLALADVVVVPQRRTEATQGQMPAKLFDAMALERPVVSTTVGDIPRVLDGCGWVVEPGDPAALAAAIADALERPDEARRRAALARRRCVERYSHDAMEHTLVPLFERWQAAR